MWGSSYLFIKIAVGDFGTFTLVALRLAIGSALLWTVLRIAGEPLPRSARVYGHLVVMAMVNIAVPFLLITWAERSVESSLAAILTSIVPLFAVVIAPLFIEDEAMRINGVVGLAIGFIGVVVLTGGGLGGAGPDPPSEIAPVGAALRPPGGAGYSRPHTPRVPAESPPGCPVTLRRGSHR